MKKLCEIVDCNYDIPIYGIKTDSRKIQKGDLFVAVKGFLLDHHMYIEDAIKNGAVAVIGEEDIELDTIYVRVQDVNKELFSILSKFYDSIENDFHFIGITGTDGKTTTATIVSKILDCCYMGTNGVFYNGVSWKTDNTTPELCQLYEYLKKLKELGCQTIVMEVSSEALLHHRVDNISYDIVCFTNITEDHLNIHKTIENYVDSKKRLFSLVKENGFSILNCDDSNYCYVKKSCKENVYSYGQGDNSDCKICQINCKKEGCSFELVYQDHVYSITSDLTLLYNVYNLTLSFLICLLSGMNSKDIIYKMKNIGFIAGRGERLNFGQDYTIILDYAHTYNGIYNIIMNVKRFSYKRIIVVTGAAGGREKEKRQKIGKMLLENVTTVIFTMDDPRYESVDSIIDQMVSETSLKNYKRVIDRKEAIYEALSMGEDGDVILILGKGRDSYMAIEDKKVSYCDYDVIKNYFLNHSYKK